MPSKALQIGWILMLILGLYRVIASILLYTTGESDISSAVLFFTNAAAIIGITLGSYRKAEKWAWWCLLVVGLLPLLTCTVLHGMMAWVIIGWILFIPAIVVPAKVILAPKPSE